MEVAAECIANIGPRERWKRLTFGVVAFSTSAVIAVLLVALDVPRVGRMPLVVPLWVAALGFFQARDKT